MLGYLLNRWRCSNEYVNMNFQNENEKYENFLV